MLEARGITVERSGRKLLDDVSVAIMPERVIAIVGPNGAGKSTLIKVLAGEIAPTYGDVFLDGRNLKTFRAAELAARRAIVPQSAVLSFPFSVIEVVKLGASVPGFDQNPEHSTRVAADALADVGLTDFRDRSMRSSPAASASVSMSPAPCASSTQAYAANPKPRCFSSTSRRRASICRTRAWSWERPGRRPTKGVRWPWCCTTSIWPPPGPMRSSS
ncbi:MAG: ATP-binding cassette domain-containing protein [Sphingomonadales bacterium]|nr:ATP-binding cassette domain-containing protein [Sphingomonadales bacterium]